MNFRQRQIELPFFLSLALAFVGSARADGKDYRIPCAALDEIKERAHIIGIEQKGNGYPDYHSFVIPIAGYSAAPDKDNPLYDLVKNSIESGTKCVISATSVTCSVFVSHTRGNTGHENSKFEAFTQFLSDAKDACDYWASRPVSTDATEKKKPAKNYKNEFEIPRRLAACPQYGGLVKLLKLSGDLAKIREAAHGMDHRTFTRNIEMDIGKDEAIVDPVAQTLSRILSCPSTQPVLKCGVGIASRKSGARFATLNKAKNAVDQAFLRVKKKALETCSDKKDRAFEAPPVQNDDVKNAI